jgi:flavin reductase (DIM6/NTAB) family NADH-FMN oxidoreductase RutF
MSRAAFGKEHLDARQLRAGGGGVILSKTPNMSAKSPTAAEFRLACGQFATGVSVVTAERAPGKVHGMTANSVTSVSLNPLLLLVCVDHRAQLLPMVRAKGHFGVSVLKQEQQAISRYFAQTVEDEATETRLGIRYRWTESGIPLLDDALVHIACRVTSAHEAGDHTIFIGEVEVTEIFDGDPLVYFRGAYRRIAL